MAQFAQPTPDENLSPGWNVQGTGSAQSTTGIPGQGYAQGAPVGASISTGQAGAGYPNPPGAGNIGAENSGSYTQSILSNPGYATGSGAYSATLTAPIPTTTGVTNPFGMNATATVVDPIGTTAIYVCPWQPTGQPSGTSAPWSEAWGGPAAAGQILSISVPPGGYIKTVGANSTSVVWTPTS
jgi:hypothetical protein